MSLSYALLGLLSGSPMNGYAIKALFDEAISHVWQAELSQIYRELEALEKKGLLSSVIEEQRDRPNKRLYQATDAGKQAFREWLQAAPTSFVTPKRDEFMLRLFFGSMAGREVMKAEFRSYLEQMRKLRDGTDWHSHLAERFPGDPAMARADQVCREDLYCGFILKRARMASETAVRWAEECLAELEAGDEPGGAGPGATGGPDLI
jgi:DNA-binding PadR family transcriptional regulator